MNAVIRLQKAHKTIRQLKAKIKDLQIRNQNLLKMIQQSRREQPDQMNRAQVETRNVWQVFNKLSDEQLDTLLTGAGVIVPKRRFVKLEAAMLVLVWRRNPRQGGIQPAQ